MVGEIDSRQNALAKAPIFRYIIMRMHKLIQQFRQNDFLRHNGIFFAGTLVVSGLNYLYYPILGRLLPAAQFGEVQALVSLFLQANIFLSVITDVTVNVVANEPDEARRNRMVFELEHAALMVTIVVLGMALVFVRQLEAFLRFEQAGPFFVLAVSLLVSVPLALRGAFLRGRSAFGRLSVSNIIGSLGKIIFSVAFVLLGWQTAGALGGLVAAQLIALGYTVEMARRLGLHNTLGLKLWRWPDFSIIKPQLGYTALVLTVSFIITTLFSFDVVAVKHYFSAELAGRYAGIATIARIIFFLTGSIPMVLLSSVRLEAEAAINRRLLVRSGALLLGLGGVVLIGFMALPTFVTEVLLGAPYTPYAYLLPPLSLAIFGLAFVNLLFNYDLALRRRSAAVVSMLGGAIMFGLVLWHHASLMAVVQSLLMGSGIMIVLRAADSVRRHL